MMEGRRSPRGSLAFELFRAGRGDEFLFSVLVSLICLVIIGTTVLGAARLDRRQKVPLTARLSWDREVSTLVSLIE
jgi:hypothetical protein